MTVVLTKTNRTVRPEGSDVGPVEIWEGVDKFGTPMYALILAMDALNPQDLERFHIHCEDKGVPASPDVVRIFPAAVEGA